MRRKRYVFSIPRAVAARSLMLATRVTFDIERGTQAPE